MEEHNTPRSYIIKTEDGSALRLNRHPLVHTEERPPLGQPHCEEDWQGQPHSEEAWQMAESCGSGALFNTDLTGSNVGHGHKGSSVFDKHSNNELMNCTNRTRTGRLVKSPVRFKDYV